jgi:hypothetical protein
VGGPTLALLDIHKWDKVSFNSSAHEATPFGDSICPVCISTFKCLFIRTQLTQALIDTAGAYHLGAPNFRLDHSYSFPSSILQFPLISPLGLQLNHSINYSRSQHTNLVSWTCHLTSTKVLSAKHGTTNGFSTTIGSRWYKKGIMHSSVSFNSYNINAQVNNNLRIIIK